MGIFEFEPSPFARREERVAYELHRAVAKKLIDHPDAIRKLIKPNVARIRTKVQGSLVHGWLDRWEELADAPIGELLEAMLAVDELSIEMRQNSPFMGALTQEERLEAISHARIVNNSGKDI